MLRQSILTETDREGEGRACRGERKGTVRWSSVREPERVQEHDGA